MRAMFTLDPAVAFPDLGRLRYAVQTGHWAGVRALLDGRPTDDRTTMTGYAAGLDARSYLTAVLAADPADGTARVLLGATLVHHAWSVRTALRAQHVSASQFREFHRILRQAETFYEGAEHLTIDHRVPADRHVPMPASTVPVDEFRPAPAPSRWKRRSTLLGILAAVLGTLTVVAAVPVADGIRIPLGVIIIGAVAFVGVLRSARNDA
jgi:hypothetical protein